MAKFTKGKWVAFPKSKYKEWHVALPCAGSSMKMALCPDGVIGDSDSEKEANANLIAAAPEMYGYLEKMRDRMNCICKFNGMLGLEVDCTKCAIDKLLAKADGTENGE